MFISRNRSNANGWVCGEYCLLLNGILRSCWGLRLSQSLKYRRLLYSDRPVDKVKFWSHSNHCSLFVRPEHCEWIQPGQPDRIWGWKFKWSSRHSSGERWANGRGFEARCKVRFILTNRLSPWNRVLEKLVVSQPVKKCVKVYGTWKFIIVFPRARPLSLSWAILIQSIQESVLLCLNLLTYLLHGAESFLKS